MKDFFTAGYEIWKDIRAPIAYALEAVFSELASIIKKCTKSTFRMFWMEDNSAMDILRMERVTKKEIVTGAISWFVFLLLNLLIFINGHGTLATTGFVLTIVSADIFLYWVKLGLTYNLKHDEVNPDREI